MNTSEAFAWLNATQTFGIKLGLDNTRRMLAALGDPHTRLRFLHVAGTNGKGSTCAMMDAILRSAGYSCGLFTSPHLVRFGERVRCNGELLPDAEAAAWLQRIREITEGWDHAPTFFEIVTVLAACWLAGRQPDFVVWETGMGGRLDATNVVRPLVSVITPIGKDHEQWLGGTLPEIAGEKAGIIKEEVPVVTLPQAPGVLPVLQAAAKANASPWHCVTEPWPEAPALSGPHQRWNAALAVAALQAAGIEVSPDAVRQGLASVRWPGRFDRVRPGLVVDGAHNPAAAEALAGAWREACPGREAALVFGALVDKDAAAILRALRPVSTSVWLVPVASGRAMPVQDLVPLAAAEGFTVHPCSSLAEGVERAGAQGETVLVTGSLFLAGELYAWLESPASTRPPCEQ